jgi:predicted ATPase/transcriptional regulator with XRE-family HTH domain
MCAGMRAGNARRPPGGALVRRPFAVRECAHDTIPIARVGDSMQSPRPVAPEPSERPLAPAGTREVAFGALVRRYRRAAGWTQEELAAQARIGMRTVSEIERGTGTRPQRETVRLLADAFGLAAEERAAFERAARQPVTAALAPIAAAPPHNLPAPTTPLIGRGDERAAVTALLRDADVRLVTVTGLGGVGKTRLALAVAADVLPQFPDGVWFVPLAAVRDPALVLATVAQTLGTPDHASQPVRERVAAHIGARRMLLVLDNFEQIVPASVAVAALLARCPGLKLLVTSRERLNVRGEHRYLLGPLAVPDPRNAEDRATWADAPAVALFVQRARAADHTFALSEGNGPAVAAICARLDGLPLAIELAAARVAFLPPAALLARLARRLPLLTGGAHDLPERHQTLRDTIAWSDDLLTDGERAVFRRLGVFVGGWTLDAAQAVCADARCAPEVVFHALESLVAKSLIRLDSDDAVPRYGMLETIREYAEERLAEHGEAEAVRRAHAAWFLSVVEGAEASIFGPERAATLERLDRERENLRAALDWAIARGDAGPALRFGFELWRYWRDRGSHAEGRDRLRAILALDGVAGHPLEEEVLFGAGLLAADQRDYDAARRAYERALALSTAAGREMSTSGTLAQLGRLAQLQGDLATARGHLEESLAIRRRLGVPWHIGSSLCLLGGLLVDQGDLATAREMLAEGLAIGEALGSAVLVDQARRHLGRLALAEGEYPTARAHLTICLRDYRSANGPHAVVAGIEHLARVALAERRPERAAQLFAAAAAMRERTGTPFTAREAATVPGWQAMACDALGPEAYEAAWQVGTSLTEDEAITLATRD